MAKKMAGPRARSQRLLVEEVGDEVVVYDLDNDFAHLLNATTAAVWRRCDGRSSFAAIAEGVKAALGEPIGEPVVLDALAQLQKTNLLEGPIDLPEHGLSRRQILKGIGIAAVTIPVVTTVLAPTPAAAASVGNAIGASCLGSQNGGNCGCASGNCVNKNKTFCQCADSGANCVCHPCTAPPTQTGSNCNPPGYSHGATTCPPYDDQNYHLGGVGAPCPNSGTRTTCNGTTGACN